MSAVIQRRAAGRPWRRWSAVHNQLTLGDALAVSLPDLDAPGKHILSGEVWTVTHCEEEGDPVPFLRGTLRMDGCCDLVPFIGRGIGDVRVGCVIEASGMWPPPHPEYGLQFAIERLYRMTTPVARDGLVRYLAANVDGVGPAIAERLVHHFGTETLDRLEAQPELAMAIFTAPGPQSERVIAGLRAWSESVAAEAWARHTAPRLMMAGDISYALARRITRYFRSVEIADLVARREPYRLLDVPGLGWKRVDRIALSMGVGASSDERVEAALCTAVERQSEHGHMATSREQLLMVTLPILGGVSADLVEKGLERCLDEAKVMEVGGLLYRPEDLRVEWQIAECIADLARHASSLTHEQRAVVEHVLSGMYLSTDQAAAVYRALESGVSLVTGGPGTGKTHTLRAVLATHSALGLEVRVLAPTGKAAARASEVIGAPANTIHRFLGGAPGAPRRDGPIRNLTLVLDEASMCDAQVMSWLLCNIDVSTRVRLVLVGDDQQLPSVGPGQVLADLIATDVLPLTRLTEIRRQAVDSRITQNAHALISGQAMRLDRTKDFVYVEAPSRRLGETAEAHLRRVQDLVIRTVRRLVTDERTSLVRRSGFDAPFDPARELQVLSPRNGDLLGVDALNARLRHLLNPAPARNVAETRISQLTCRVGDRVICTRNEYRVGDRGIMNGEQGIVTQVDPSNESITIRLDDGRAVTTFGPQNYLLQHAFCTTVHRSQGSEFPFVVVVYHSSHSVRDVRLLYTAITRARRRLVLISDRDALDACARGTVHALDRRTGLTMHLRAARGYVG